jgi:hypothetical protein
MPDSRDSTSRSPMTCRTDRGSALVEFAMVSLVLTLLMAATIDFGRMMFSAQALQDVARVAARELAISPVKADVTFEYALTCNPVDEPLTCVADLKQRIFDPACLVVDLDTFANDDEVDALFASMPVVNKALRPLMIMDHSGGRNLLRYPGALLDANVLGCAGHVSTSLTVGIPRVDYGGGVETITWVPVLEEIRSGADPTTGVFSLTDLSGVLPNQPRGLAAVRINYPYQAAMMTGFRANPIGPLEPNLATPITVATDELSITQTNSAPGALRPDSPDPDEPVSVGPYAGPFGLGHHYSSAKIVRPFRKLITAQAIYRREVFE